MNFCIAPYFLKLELPGNVLDDDRANASYDISSGFVHIKFPKETPGEVFPDLDLLTTLLVNQNKEPVKKPLIEEVEDTPSPSTSQNASKDEEKEVKIDWQNIHFDDPDFDWGLLQRLDDEKMQYTSTSQYGFNNQYSGLLKYNALVGNEINQIPEPERTPPSTRSEIRVQLEDEKFDAEHYMADFYDREMIDEILHYIPDYIGEFLLVQQGKSDRLLEFTSEEKEALAKLPKRSYLIDNPKNVYLCLVPLIFAYAYDNRTTLGDPTIESCWNIGTLSSTISCLDTNFLAIKDIFIACIRRSLAYPLYRNWDLALTCWKDTHAILSLGKRWILRVLLRIRNLFEHHDVYYIYNAIVLNDYAYWIQTANDNVLAALAYQVSECTITKEETNWPLEEIEANVQETIIASDEESESIEK